MLKYIHIRLKWTSVSVNDSDLGSDPSPGIRLRRTGGSLLCNSHNSNFCASVLSLERSLSASCCDVASQINLTPIYVPLCCGRKCSGRKKKPDKHRKNRKCFCRTWIWTSREGCGWWQPSPLYHLPTVWKRPQCKQVFSSRLLLNQERVKTS